LRKYECETRGDCVKFNTCTEECVNREWRLEVPDHTGAACEIPWEYECKCIQNKCVSEGSVEACPEGCVCSGDEVSCQVDDEEVKIMKKEDTVIITVDGKEVESDGDVSVRGGRVFVEGDDGVERQLKIMPDKASEIAVNKLGDIGFLVELRENGNYLVEARKKARLLGIFPIGGNVEIEIDGRTGEVINEKRPWWSFLASGI